VLSVTLFSSWLCPSPFSHFILHIISTPITFSPVFRDNRCIKNISIYPFHIFISTLQVKVMIALLHVVSRNYLRTLLCLSLLIAAEKEKDRRRVVLYLIPIVFRYDSSHKIGRCTKKELNSLFWKYFGFFIQRAEVIAEADIIEYNCSNMNFSRWLSFTTKNRLIDWLIIFI